MVRVVFLHPDLGIGGAERLVVDAALALKSRGHDVRFVTSHHDPRHCFPETADGSLPVTVAGDWLPRKLFGRFYALCAYIRMVYASLYLILSDFKCDVIFCDQISACIPVLKFIDAKVLFYCHFPDQLLTQRKSWLKKLYRVPIDWLEEWSMGKADKILVNSRFTAKVFEQTFPSLRVKPRVLYPSLNSSAFDSDEVASLSDLNLPEHSHMFLSVNRYERKKNLPLAILAFGRLKALVDEGCWQGCHLVMAGGYDNRVTENIEHYKELQKLVEDEELKGKVTLLKSPSDAVKRALYRACSLVLYTPDKEHFGIVPIEAMYCSKMVICVNSGGPTETVLDGSTGYVTEGKPDQFALCMKKYVSDPRKGSEMGRQGKQRVKQHFSFSAFTDQLEDIMDNLLTKKKRN